MLINKHGCQNGHFEMSVLIGELGGEVEMFYFLSSMKNIELLNMHNTVFLYVTFNH